MASIDMVRSYIEEQFDCSSIYEVCPYCGVEEEFKNWDVKRDGYVAICPDCGKEMMLCDMCMHTDVNGNDSEFTDYCDWHKEDGCESCSCYRRYFKTRKDKKTMESFSLVCKEIESEMKTKALVDTRGCCVDICIKKALIGEPESKQYLLSNIGKLLVSKDLDCSTIPSWYSALSSDEAVYAELYGWGPVAEWFTDAYADSPVFFVQGETCSIERGGHQKLMKQRASKEFLDRIFNTLSLTHSTNSTDFREWKIELKDGTLLTVAENDDLVFSRPTPCAVTKQDITQELWSKFTESPVGVAFDMDCIASCEMRKTNSFGITLKDGRCFKVIVKDIKDEE